MEVSLISELPPGTPGYKANFPARNRIISGLSLGVLVIEAKQKSGALITAHWAKKQKRKLFAIPGPIHSSNSKGPHQLIKQGAILVQKADDILKELNLPCSTWNVKQQTKGKTTEENLILEALKEKSLFIDEIIKTTNLPVQKVCSILAIMEIEGKIRNLGNNVYSLKR